MFYNISQVNMTLERNLKMETYVEKVTVYILKLKAISQPFLNDSMDHNIDQFLSSLTNMSNLNSTESLMYVVDGLVLAEKKLNEGIQEFSKQVISEKLNMTLSIMTEGFQNVISSIDKKRCQPLVDEFFSVTDSVCIDFLNPLNVLWFSLWWCMFYLNLAVILSSIILRQYKTDNRNHQVSGEDDNSEIFEECANEKLPHLANPNASQLPYYDDMNHGDSNVKNDTFINTHEQGDGLHQQYGHPMWHTTTHSMNPNISSQGACNTDFNLVDNLGLMHGSIDSQVRPYQNLNSEISAFQDYPTVQRRYLRNGIAQEGSFNTARNRSGIFFPNQQNSFASESSHPLIEASVPTEDI